MHRLSVMAVVAGISAVLWAGAALANQCPTLVKKISDEAGRRLDNASYDARQAVPVIMKLHTDGKHDEAEKLAKEHMAKLGIQ